MKFIQPRCFFLWHPMLSLSSLSLSLLFISNIVDFKCSLFSLAHFRSGVSNL
jgi:hypothetical protein